MKCIQLSIIPADYKPTINFNSGQQCPHPLNIGKNDHNRTNQSRQIKIQGFIALA